ncbi:MAG: glycoside hydrolase 43 family protein [Ferruginibacter sp.]
MLNRKDLLQFLCGVLCCLFSSKLAAQVNNNSYQNPILHLDYSDPDAIKVGDDYYMTASSFNAVPGLPLLHSKDLVHWKIIGYALKELKPAEVFDQPQHGNGVWAPAIRYHNNEFYIYYPDPDRGIYLVKAKKITGPWTEPILVEEGKGLIDPCPLWDDNGKNYLVHAYAGSRAGFKSIIVLKELNAAADKVISDAVLLYDGHEKDPTIEGPKIYKRNKYYYIFAPAGGVSTGWQVVLRSRRITGPYERKIVMAQGKSPVNGPHQGAWVQTQNAESWFLHFQDKDAYGRIVHLQPMVWKNDWPVIGNDADGDGTGEPVSNHTMPFTPRQFLPVEMQESDEFNEAVPGLQWQWHANKKSYWAFFDPSRGVLRLNSILQKDSLKNLWETPNLLLQKLPAEQFTATAKLSFEAKTTGERIGMLVMGTSYAYISLLKKEAGTVLTYNTCINADKGNPGTENVITTFTGKDIYFRIKVEPGAKCSFAYSIDGNSFTEVPEVFTAAPGKWIGAKIGFFCNRSIKTNDAGFAEIDWFRIKK